MQEDGGILIHQPLYTKEKVKEIPISRDRKSRKFTLCNKEEITQLRGLLGSLAWLSKETRPDLAGRTALLQQSMPQPYIQDLLDANALAREALRSPSTGIRIQPIPPERLRVGTITDASWVTSSLTSPRGGQGLLAGDSQQLDQSASTTSSTEIPPWCCSRRT